MTELRFTLPEPPSANRYWRHGRVRTYIAKEALAYREAVRWAYLSSQGHGRLTFPKGPVRIALRWYRVRKTGDLDNRIKQALDALRGVAYLDDAQVVEIHASRHDDKACPRLEVVLSQP